MRFEVRYASGAAHEVELQGTIAVLGRDPSCDLVLNDTKCSRRHAVIEAGAQGIAIRDAGSANGIFVNGQKVERASLVDGDVVRLGEVLLKVLPEDVPGTIVMGPDDVDPAFPKAGPAAPPPRAAAPPPPIEETPALPRPSPPRSAPPKSAPPPAPSPAPPPVQRPAPPSRQMITGLPTEPPRTSARGTIPRPPTVTLLAALWGVSGLLYGLGGIAFAVFGGQDRMVGLGSAAGGAVLALVSFAMAFGLFSRQGWARVLQIALGALGLLMCPFTLASGVILFYMLRGAARVHFSGKKDLSELQAADAELATKDPAELAFAGALLGALLIAVVSMGVLGYFARARAIPVQSPPTEVSPS